jgi:hypothetical protein
MFEDFAKLLIFFGIILVVIGVLFLVIPKLPYLSNLGRLPGDIYIKKGNFVFYFPIVTSILLSIVLTIIINLILRKK